MRYFHSNKNFNQYKPHESFWQRFKKRRQKKTVKSEAPINALKNPYKREVEPRLAKNKVIFSTFLILIISWIGLMLTLPYFKITNISIAGNKITSAQEVKDFINQSKYLQPGIIGHNNYFLFNYKDLANDIKTKFLYDDVQVIKTFPNTINVNLTEKTAQIIYDNNNTYNLLDIDGKVVKTISIPPQTLSDQQASFSPPTSSTSTVVVPNYHTTDYQNLQAQYGKMPIIVDKRSVTSKKTDYLLSAKIIKTALDWTKQLKQQGIGDVAFFALGDNETNLKITLGKPWYLLINTELDYQTQIKNLKIITTNNNPAEYIDLRFGERVYWK